MAEAAEQSGWRFSLGAVPVLVRPAFLVIPAFGALSAGLARGAAWVAIVFVSVLVHELGHAAAMRAFGFSPWIELHGLGGSTHWPAFARPTAGRSLLVSLAGPGAGLAVGLPMLAVRALVPMAPGGLAADVVWQWLWVNVGWSCINLLPVLPWDGGQALDAGLAWLTRRPRPRLVGTVSMLSAVAVLAGAVWLRSILLGYFGLMGLASGWRRFASGARRELRTEAWKKLIGGRFDEVEAVAAEGLAQTEDDGERTALLELLAWARLSRGDFAGAREAAQSMTPVPPLLSRAVAAEGVEPLVVMLEAEPELPLPARLLVTSAWVKRGAYAEVVALCERLSAGGRETPLEPQFVVQHASERLFHARAFEASLAVCTLAFARFGDPVHAYNAACCLGQLGRAEEGLQQLSRALDAGYTSVDSIIHDPDLAPIRALPGFRPLLARARMPARIAARPGHAG